MSFENNEIPEEAIKLLPWYSIGGLSAEEHSYIQKLLLEHPELQKQLDAELKIVDLISNNKDVLNLSSLKSPEDRLRNVIHKIDERSELSSNKKPTGFNLSEKIRSWFSFPLTPQRLSYAFVAVLSVTLLFAFISPLVIHDQSQQGSFQPATSHEKSKPNNSKTATILLVGIKGDPEFLRSLSPLKNKIDSIKSVTSKENMYRISLKQTLAPKAVKELIDLLLSNKEKVWFAGEAY